MRPEPHICFTPPERPAPQFRQGGPVQRNPADALAGPKQAR
jgi:hypothetical protein